MGGMDDISNNNGRKLNSVGSPPAHFLWVMWSATLSSEEMEIKATIL